MKNSTRLLTALVVAATAVTVGLSSASAGPARAPSWQPSGSSGAQAPSAQQVPDVALAPSTSHSLFVPITPCRIADTRSGGGAIPNLGMKTFYVQGTFGFAPQGGHSGGCGVPSGASGVTTNVTTTAAVAHGGYLTGYPAGAAEPATNFISYSTGVTTTANPTFALGAGTAPSLTIRVHGGSVQIIIDVTGYYRPQIEGIIAPNGSIYAGTKSIISIAHPATGFYVVTTDSDVSNCAVTVTVRGGVYYGDGYGSGSTVYVSTWQLSSTATNIPTDLYVSFAVTC